MFLRDPCRAPGVERRIYENKRQKVRAFCRFDVIMYFLLCREFENYMAGILGTAGVYGKISLLHRVQRIKVPLFLHQLVKAAVLCDAAVLHDEDTVIPAQQRLFERVRHNYACDAL